MISATQAQVDAALAAVEQHAATAAEKAAMLVEIAMGLQAKPRAAEDFDAAIELYRRALELIPAGAKLERARAAARLATALTLHPGADAAALERARDLLEAAAPMLKAQGDAAEWAESNLNLGLTVHSLAGLGRARIGDAIAAYQRALTVFRPPAFVAEFAVLHNNLATAYLAAPAAEQAHKVREALAVQSFEAALKHVDRSHHPREYAMLQNNLGNALQYAASGHPLDNNLRALQAYEQALTVRTERNSPHEYANTLANLGNCLSNLPADAVDGDPLARARTCWREAERVFRACGESGKAQLMADNLQELNER